LGRAITVQKQYGSNSLATVANYDYDDMGRLVTKHLDPNHNGGNGLPDLESLNYSFNIHNQITGINKDYALKNPANYNKWNHFFGLYLGFDNKDNTFNAARLNGQVTGLLWNTQGDDAQRKYDYSYDNANRLVNAAYKEQSAPGNGWSNGNMDFSVSGSSGQITYDLNGNLLTMLQKGVMPGSSSPLTIDDLHYAYNAYSNQLQSVTDQMTTTNLNGQFGDFKDGTNAAGTADYVYDANGNVVVDLNKNVQSLNGGAGGSSGISYNFLDKPEQINIVGKGLIQIVYDADGNKLQRAYTPTAGTTTTVTTYINQYVYTETVAAIPATGPAAGGWGAGTDTLRYINFEEGRIRLMQPVSQGNGFDALIENGNLTMLNGMMGAYDYFIRDYQQNVRMILTEESHQSSSTCTMETGRSSIEDGIFGQAGSNNEVEATRISTPPGWTGNSTASVSGLGNSVNGGQHNLGPNILQKVMAGDTVTATVQYYHQANATSSSTNLIPDIISNLVMALGTNSSVSRLLENNVTNVGTQLNNTTPPVITNLPTNQANVNAPKAYLTVLFFDERFNFITAANSSQQIQVNPSVGSGGAVLALTNIQAPKNGYVYVYVSNQSDQTVYFDNMQVGVKTGNIIEEDHYYAYGLKIAGISSKKLGDAFEGNLKNNNLYNDKEFFDDGDINWYDYGYRNYDPQIGRFMQLDPLTDDYPELTPYQYASNDPITNIDIDGLEGGNVVSDIGEAAGSASTLGASLHGAESAGEAFILAGLISNSSTTIKVINKASSGAEKVTFYYGIVGELGKSIKRFKTTDNTKPVGNFKTTGPTVQFTNTSVDLDGGVNAYKKKDKGNDFINPNGKSGGILKVNGKWQTQKNNPDNYVSPTAGIKNKKIPESANDQNRYYDPEKDAFVALNPKLKAAGIKKYDKVLLTYTKKDGTQFSTIAIVGDVGPADQDPNTLEMSVETFSELNLNIGMQIPNSKTKNPFDGNNPYDVPKYMTAPDGVDIKVRKIK